MIKKVLLPNIGEGINTADVSEILIKIGDSIIKDDPIVVLESEKATMEIPSPETGRVKAIFMKPGDKIEPGQKIISLETTNGDNDSITEVQTPEESKETKILAPIKPSEVNIENKTDIKRSPEGESGKIPFASPGVRRFARELGANLNFVQGTGEKGRITKEDVQKYIKSQLSGLGVSKPKPPPQIDFSQWGTIEITSLNKIRRITGERMTTAWQTIPQVTNFDKIDITDLDILRHSSQKTKNKKELKITLLPFLIKVATKALMEFPEVNSSLEQDGETLILKKYYHIRIAVDTPEGLTVPVIRNVDQKDIYAISDELADVSQRARNKRLSLDDLAGGTFTISSLGGIGGTYFTPIVNPPEVAIMGVSRATHEMVFNGKNFETRLILPVTLSYDHRVIDGALAARFMKFFNILLSDTKKLSDANII